MGMKWGFRKYQFQDDMISLSRIVIINKFIQLVEIMRNLDTKIFDPEFPLHPVESDISHLGLLKSKCDCTVM